LPTIAARIGILRRKGIHRTRINRKGDSHAIKIQRQIKKEQFFTFVWRTIVIYKCTVWKQQVEKRLYRQFKNQKRFE